MRATTNWTATQGFRKTLAGRVGIDSMPGFVLFARLISFPMTETTTEVRHPAATRAAGPSLAYRRDIEGLRAVAVAAVVLFHAGVPGVGGGYIGVDVFFVISGFLITSLMLR